MTPQELDHWAAEKVMGWNILVRDYPRPGHPWLYKVDGTEVMALYKWTPSDPTTGQIWLVIEKMRELGWDFRLDYPVRPDDCLAGFIRINGDILENHDGIDPNPCLAILKAAHEATEVPIPISDR